MNNLPRIYSSFFFYRFQIFLNIIINIDCNSNVIIRIYASQSSRDICCVVCSPPAYKLCCKHASRSGYHMECNLSVHIYQVHNNRLAHRKYICKRNSLMGNNKSYRCTEFDFCPKAFSYSGGKSPQQLYGVG